MSERSRPVRLIRLAGMAPLAPLVLATVLVALAGDGPPRPLGATVALAVATGAWTCLLLTHPRWGHRICYRIGYFAGLLVLMSALILTSPWYAMVTGLALPQALVLFPSSRGALAALVAASVLPVGVQSAVTSSGWPEPTYALLSSLVLPLLVASWIAGRENDRRRALLRQLTDTQQELVDQAHRAGVAVERSRITGELHDTLTQALTATISHLEAARHAADSEEQTHQVERAAGMAREGLVESRRTLRALRPEALDGHSLNDALRALRTLSDEPVEPALSDRSSAGAVTGPTGAPSIQVWIAGTPGPWATERATARGALAEPKGPAEPKALAEPEHTGDAETTDRRESTVPAEIEHALYRVAREAVTNAVRHARARTVHLSLSWLDDLVLLDITDDGTGFDVRGTAASTDGQSSVDGDGNNSSSGGGWGISVMRQRVRHVGGELMIESAPDEGTVVSASIPLVFAARSES